VSYRLVLVKVPAAGASGCCVNAPCGFTANNHWVTSYNPKGRFAAGESEWILHPQSRDRTCLPVPRRRHVATGGPAENSRPSGGTESRMNPA
jgi:hypothetical protein